MDIARTISITLQPSAADPGPYPTAPSFGTLRTWQETKAQNNAYNSNQNKAQDYLSTTYNTWLASYSAGRLPWDAVPPPPPLQQVVLGTETYYSNGAFGFSYDLVDNLSGIGVCPIPDYKKLPPPEVGGNAATGGLMGQMVGEGKVLTTLVPLVEAGNTTESADGETLWLRLK